MIEENYIKLKHDAPLHSDAVRHQEVVYMMDTADQELVAFHL